MKTAFTILIIALLILSCNEKPVKTNEIQNSELNKQKNLTKTEATKPRPVIDIIHGTENLRLYGDTTIDKEKISYASLKFEPYIGFSDFKVTRIDHKKYASLDLKSNKDAGNFQTRLRKGYGADTANFAGHYSFVYWGCGSPCQRSLVIDRKTGKIYDSPEASLGYYFRVDSRMLIVNPPDTSGFYDDCFYCKPIIYIFNEQTKKFVERQRKLE